MSVKRVYELVVTSCVFCFIWLFPANIQAAPQFAWATAGVSARVMSSASIGITYDLASSQPLLRVSHTGKQVYQLHIGETRRQSYAKIDSGQQDLLNSPPHAGQLLAQNHATTPSVMLYFN